MELKDKLALVTGGGRGIGKAISSELARQGAKVFLAGTRLEVAEDTAKIIRDQGGDAHAIRMDVSNSEEIQEVFQTLSKEHKAVDILVNNAGITRDGLMMRMKEEDWDEVIRVNLKGTFLCGQLAMKQMIKQKSGSIVNISSVVGLSGNFGQANYTASKAGMIGLTKTMAREVAARGITVNAIAPGFIETEMTDKLDDQIKKDLLEKIPLTRFGTPEEVAYGVSFLVSERAKYITGQVININGGMLM